MNNSLTIRNLALNEMYIADQMAELDNRNPGLNDGEFLFNLDDKGFIGAVMGTQVAGTISFVRYPDNLGFIGLHIVVPHLQSNGLSEKLLSVVLEYAGETNIGVNCRPELVPMYEKAGFKSTYKILTYEGESDGKLNIAENVQSPFMIPFDELYDYYKKHVPYEHKPFTSYWLNQPKSLLLGKYVDNKYKGFGLFKPCKNGYRLAPLISDDAESARDLIISLSTHFDKGTKYYLDMPETNQAGINLAGDLGLTKIDEKIRMYKGEEHQLSIGNVYSFTSLEVG